MMKCIMLFGYGCILSLSLSAQKMRVNEAANNMILVTPNTSNLPFWIGKEVTNKEYRQYYESLKHNLTGELVWFDYDTIANVSSQKKINRNMKPKKRSIQAPVSLSDIIDTTKLPFPGYFTNCKYDDYPVVGVSYTDVMFYITWKNNLAFVKDVKEHSWYRLPRPEELIYAARHFKGNDSIDTPNVIQPVRAGQANLYGIYNLFGNVSEWTYECVSSNKIYIFGGSWKKGPSISVTILDRETRASDIGFRVARTDGKVKEVLYD